MNTHTGFLPTCAALIGLSVAMVSCKPAAEPTGIVEIHAEPGILFGNYSTMEMSVAGTDGSFAVYLPDATLLYVFCNDETNETNCAAFLYLYLPEEDGSSLDLRISEGRLYVNETVRSIFLAAPYISSIQAWLESADTKAIQSLRNVYCEMDAIPEAIISRLQMNPHLTVAQDDAISAPIGLEQRPLFLFIESAHDLTEEQIEKLDCSALRFLYCTSPETIAALGRKGLPQLSSIVAELHEETELPEAFSKVTSATLVFEGAPRALSRFLNLQHLVLGSEDHPVDLGSLRHHDKLKSLTIIEDTGVSGMDRLTGLEHLNPGEVILSDKVLTALIARHPKLRDLNLMHAEIESFEPLRSVPKLEMLCLGGFQGDSLPDLSPLKALRQLRYISLAHDDMENHPEYLESIKQACPGCIVYTHDELCLGAGWLIVFIPLLLLLLFITNKRGMMLS